MRLGYESSESESESEVPEVPDKNTDKASNYEVKDFWTNDAAAAAAELETQPTRVATW